MPVIAHLSDMHLDGTPRRLRRLNAVLEEVAALPEVDALLLSGDYNQNDSETHIARANDATADIMQHQEQQQHQQQQTCAAGITHPSEPSQPHASSCHKHRASQPLKGGRPTAPSLRCKSCAAEASRHWRARHPWKTVWLGLQRVNS